MFFVCHRLSVRSSGCLVTTSIRLLFTPPWHTHTQDLESDPCRPDLQFVLMIFCVRERGGACGKYACFWCDLWVFVTRTCTQFHVTNHQYKLQIWAMQPITKNRETQKWILTEKRTYPCTPPADVCRTSCSASSCRMTDYTLVPRSITMLKKIRSWCGRRQFPW